MIHEYVFHNGRYTTSHNCIFSLFIERVFKVKQNRVKEDSNRINGLIIKEIGDKVWGLRYMDFGEKGNNIKDDH